MYLDIHERDGHGRWSMVIQDAGAPGVDRFQFHAIIMSDSEELTDSSDI